MNLIQLFTILKARWWAILLVFIVVTASTLIVTLLLPKTYKADAVMVADSKGQDPISGLVMPVSPQFMPGYMATQVDIIKSDAVTRRVIFSLGLDKNPAVNAQFLAQGEGGDLMFWLTETLQKQLEVKPSRESNVITLSYSGNDPVFVAEMANTYAKAYIQTNLELRTEPAKQVSVWYEQQLKILRKNLDDAQAKLSEYQQVNGIVAMDERLDVENSRLIELSSLATAAKGQTFELRAKQQALSEAQDALSEVTNNSLIQSLKSDISRAEAKLSEMSNTYGLNHPKFVEQKNLVSELRGNLENETKKIRSNVKGAAEVSSQREESIKTTLIAQKEKVLKIKKARDDLSVLSRDLENAQRAYDLALHRSTQTKLESQLSHTDVVILSPAVPPNKPFSPKKTLNTLLGGVMGLFLGVALALFIELVNRKVRSAHDLVTINAGPVLADFK